jgi:alpha-beta hydrolase superfamily lysophospholipase
VTISTPILFGPEERPLFGWVHQPDDGLQRATAILCPPVAREYISAHDTYRVLADALAERGITAIRFDYDGTADSAGGEDDPERMDAYLGSVGHAIDLADRLGTTELVLVGMRMGALLAAGAAAVCPRVTTLVLWDPCASGREFLREQSALFRLRYGRSHPENGGTEIPGFVLSPQSVESLASTVAPSSLPQVERALVLNRPDRPPAGLFGVAEDRVECVVAEGQAELMDVEPFHSEVPKSTEFVADWLDGALPTGSSPQPVPEGRDHMELTNAAGVPVTERLIRLGPHRLFGIETRGVEEPTGPPVLFLNSGRDPHSGPNRLWVDLARNWAGLGFRCIRFDLSGLGDSPVRPGQAMHVVRPPEAFDDVADIVGEVVGEDPGNGVASVVLVGLCAGAYQALESAIDLRPRAVLAINPLLRFEPPESRTGPVDPRRRFCRPAGALRRTYRTLPSWKVLRLARKGYLFATRFRSGHRSGIYWLNELSVQGTDVLCICGEAEASAFFEGERSSAEQIIANRDAGIDVINGLDHGLIVARQRSEVVERLTEHIVARHLEAEPERSSSSAAL